MSKKILITFPFGIAARNMISAGVIEKLLARGCDIIIAAPESGFRLLREVYKGEKITLIPYPDYGKLYLINHGRGFAERFLVALINSTLNTRTVRWFKKKMLLRKKYLLYAALSMPHFFLRGNMRALELLRRLDDKFFPDKIFKKIFDEHKPDAAVSTHVQMEHRFIKRAKAQGVPSIGCVLSIDNLTSKGVIRAKPDLLLVWNELMKQEALTHNNFKPERVLPVGISQYDIYHDASIFTSRAEFCKKINVDPASNIVLYASEAAQSRDDAEMVDLLLNAKHENRFVKPVSIVARIHPRDTNNPFKKFIGNAEVYIDDSRTDQSAFVDKWYPSRENIIWLANLIYHSSLTVMTGSTFAFDVSCLDKPVISLNFDLLPTPYFTSKNQFYKEYDHHDYWLKTGAIRLADGPDSLISEINRYLLHPEAEAAEREQLRRKIVYKYDGHVGDRIAEAIAQIRRADT
ncbi:CDP-glycerol glycerophosphotransferase family protein [Candidatus Uhrbacteria bacterium]|nr:CDP-glycerol glycerophosphotransferase family protein [Candidatus Uhrbacteria bacterium]